MSSKRTASQLAYARNRANERAIDLAALERAKERERQLADKMHRRKIGRTMVYAVSEERLNYIQHELEHPQFKCG